MSFSRALNEFEVYTEFSGGTARSVVSNPLSRGRPVRVVVRAIQTGRQVPTSDLQRREALTYAIREEVVRQIMAYRSRRAPWTRTFILENIRGYLQGINLINASSSISRDRLLLADLDASFIDELMAAIHESNMDVDLLDIEWFKH